MTPEPSRVFRVLAGEAVNDAVRRRIVAAIAVVSLLSLVAVDGCTACGTPTIVQDGVAVQLPEVAGWTGMLIFAVLGLWAMVLAGVLASDHLAEPLSDGSAVLVLARPVSRSTFALARLVGALAIAFATAFVLLGGSTAMLYARNGVALGGALWGGLACAAGAVIVASLAMTLSLFLPRVATLFSILAGVAVIAGVNALALSGVELNVVAWAIDRFGPPLGSALIAALAGWIDPVAVPADPLEISIRSGAWAVAGVSLLVVTFRSRDIAN